MQLCRLSYFFFYYLPIYIFQFNSSSKFLCASFCLNNLKNYSKLNLYRYWHDLSRNLVLINTSNFFTDIKIAQTCRVSAIYSLWKICKCLLRQIAREIMLLLVDNLHETTSFKSEANEILRACACAICNFRSCYNLALVL